MVAVRSCAICCNGVECLLAVVGNAEKMVMRWLLARCRGEKMVLRELAVWKLLLYARGKKKMASR